ncbi:MAG TPA: phasin family protein [Xanthomonadaceae bacterium]|nr:phasin family protein [Xanthomonadaceae bacterium]
MANNQQGSSEQGHRRFDDATRAAGTGGADDRSTSGGSNWSESARQVWLAGVGAWSRAQNEGSKLFDGLVRDGMEAEREGGTATHVRDWVNRGAGDVRGDVRSFATGTWDRVGQFVEDAVQRSLLRLGVPRREDLDALGRRIDTLSNELREARAAGVAGTATPARRRSATQSAAKQTARSPGTGEATRKPPA